MINRRNESNVHNVFGYRKFNDDFVDQVTVYCSDDGTSTIKFSYDNFLLKLFKYLNIAEKPNNMTEEEIEKGLNEKLAILNSSDIKYTLKDEFPEIFSDYHNGLAYLDQVNKIKAISPEDKNRKNAKKNYYYRCALHPTYYKFVDRQKDVYSRFVNRRNEYKEAVKKSGLNHGKLKQTLENIYGKKFLGRYFTGSIGKSEGSQLKFKRGKVRTDDYNDKQSKGRARISFDDKRNVDNQIKGYVKRRNYPGN